MPTGKPTKMKPCKICGDMFLPEKPSSKICKKTHYAHCPVCTKLIVWNTTRSVEPCSKECKKEATRMFYREKYGCDHPMQNKQVQEHHKQSMKEKYGVESPLQSLSIKQKVIETNQSKFGSDWALGSQEIKHKAEKTMLERYGAKTTLESDELKSKVKATMVERYGAENASNCTQLLEKRKKTNLNRYGVENPMQNPEISSKSAESRKIKIDDILIKSKETWMKTLGVDNPSKSTEVLDKITATFIEKYGVKRAVHVPEFREKMISTMIERYGVPYYCMSDEHKSSDHFKISKKNQLFIDKLRSIGIGCDPEFPLDRKSYDIRISNSNILVELDPTYTHNIIGNHWNKNGIPLDYHLKKTQLATCNGYRCIHVFDWDDEDAIIKMLSPKKTLYARNMKVWRINLDVAQKFLKENHLQGSCRGQLLCLGLVSEGILYQIMTFGKPRYNSNYDVELLRLCTKSGYSVVGGASKLMKHATQDWGLHNIISYCDLSKFNGDVYEKIGMKLIRTTPPQEIWSRGDKKITANLLRQRGYDQLFGTDYGKGSSNEQLMLENGWLPVYDCGQAVYEYK